MSNIIIFDYQDINLNFNLNSFEAVFTEKKVSVLLYFLTTMTNRHVDKSFLYIPFIL